MTNQTALFQYRRAVTRQASVTGLVIALHDTLLGNLRRAAQAIETGDIPTRCSELIHGFKVLQQLETMLDIDHGGSTAAAVHRFYVYTRGQMLKAQFTLSASLLREQMQGVLEVRQAWQQLENSPAGKPAISLPIASSSQIINQQGQSETRASFTCVG